MKNTNKTSSLLLKNHSRETSHRKSTLREKEMVKTLLTLTLLPEKSQTLLALIVKISAMMTKIMIFQTNPRFQRPYPIKQQERLLFLYWFCYFCWLFAVLILTPKLTLCIMQLLHLQHQFTTQDQTVMINTKDLINILLIQLEGLVILLFQITVRPQKLPIN